ncbi:MAG: RNA-binding S4 domain-containing protein [Hyphomicrobium sp.]
MTADARIADPAGGAPGTAQRLDKWLWFARVVKSRTLAATHITAGRIRVNRVRAEKPSQLVRSGDVITSNIAKAVRVLKVVAPGERRGPASEAVRLYEDLTPPPEAGLSASGSATEAKAGLRDAGSGRPTKRDRRVIDRLQGR